MSRIVVQVPSVLISLDEIRPRIDAALAEKMSSHLQWRWEGAVLHVWGWGARGTITLEDGLLMARAELRPPASFFGATIEERLAAALHAAAEG